MSPLGATKLDICDRPPTALELAGLRPTVAVVAVDPWDFTAWAGQVDGQTLAQGFLPAISRLAEAWRPARERGGEPGLDLIERARALWAEGSYERGFFETALSSARTMDPRMFARNEREILRAERRRSQDVRVVAFYELLLAVVRELERARKTRDRVIASGDPDPEFVRWTLANIEAFLRAHWAMQRAHEDIRLLLEQRRKAVARLAGSIDVPGLSAEEHGDVA